MPIPMGLAASKSSRERWVLLATFCESGLLPPSGEELLRGATAPLGEGVLLGAGEFVRVLVPLVPGVTVDLHPVHLATGSLGGQLLPEIAVLHWLPIRRPPAVALPALKPFLEILHHVGGVDVDAHVRLRGQGTQSGDDRHQLHLVVRGFEGATGDLPPLGDAIGTAGEKDCRVSTGAAGLVGAGAIGPDVVSEVAERNHDARSLTNDCQLDVPRTTRAACTRAGACCAFHAKRRSRNSTPLLR